MTPRTTTHGPARYFSSMDTIMMTQAEIEAMLKGARPPLPDRPGLWAFRYHDGREVETRVRWLDLNEDDPALTTTAGEPVEDVSDSGTWGRYLGP